MRNRIHFISGLPRAGSTLLAAILRQNPGLHAGMTSPVGALFTALLGEMSQRNEFALFISDMQREAILRGLFENYYAERQPDEVIFDTNRQWCAKLPTLAALFPDARVIACVREVGWVFDSLERLIRGNRFEPSKIFNFDPAGTVYSRVEGLRAPGGLVGYAWNALREAYYGEQADRLMLLTYETLTRQPTRAMEAVYDFIGEPPFAHDFRNVAYAEDEFDARLGTPGLHRVGPQVQYQPRQTLLPPDIWRMFDSDSFWADPKLNLRGVRVV